MPEDLQPQGEGEGKSTTDYGKLLDEARADLAGAYPDATSRQIEEGAEFRAGLEQARSEGKLELTPEQLAYVDSQMAEAREKYPNATPEQLEGWRAATIRGIEVVSHFNQTQESPQQSRRFWDRLRRR